MALHNNPVLLCRYHKLVNFPCDVQPKTTKATYKNGVIDVIIKRKERKKKGEGYRVKHRKFRFYYQSKTLSVCVKSTLN